MAFMAGSFVRPRRSWAGGLMGEVCEPMLALAFRKSTPDGESEMGKDELLF